MTIALALSAQGATFNKTNLKGSYSFLTNLWTANVNTSQIAMVGILQFDGAGSVAGLYTSTNGGVVQTGTLGGSYTVNSNGTGAITFTTGSTAQFAITLESTAAKVAHSVQLLQTNDSNNEIVSGTAVLQSTTPVTYSAASVTGNFGFQWSLWTADANGQQTSVIGMITFDGKGSSKGSQTTVFGGGGIQTGTFTGTYTVNSDGSGSIATANGTQFACALNTVAAGQAKAAQCLVTELNGHSLGNYAMSGTVLKQ